MSNLKIIRLIAPRKLCIFHYDIIPFLNPLAKLIPNLLKDSSTTLTVTVRRSKVEDRNPKD